MSSIYLASASPRRRELLQQIGVAHRVVRVEVCEDLLPGEAPEVYVLRLALAKARAGRALLHGDDPAPVLGADTTVVVDGDILGKPIDRADGLRMMARLAGRSHHVYTGVALVGPEGWEATRLSSSTVYFRSMSDAEREAYWATGEPADKAGGYGIQGKAALFIERIEGSFSGVMGLPLFETGELLDSFGMGIALGWSGPM